jgi:hypothetical protein
MSGQFSHVAASIETNVVNAQLRIAQFDQTIDIAGSDTVQLQRIFDDVEGTTTTPLIDDSHVEVIVDNKTDAGNGYANIYIKPTSTLSSTGTAQGGTSTTIQLAAAETAADDAYNGLSVYIVSGTGAGQIATVTDYVQSTDTATVASWSVATPDNTSVYIIGSIFYPSTYIGTWKIIVNNGSARDSNTAGHNTDASAHTVTFRESLKYSVSAVVASNAGSGVISSKTAANIAGSPSNPLAVSADETYTNDVVATVTIRNVVLPIIGSIYVTVAGDQEDADKDKLGVLVADQDQSTYSGSVSEKSCTFGIEVTGGLAGITSFQEGIEFTFVATDNAGRNITGTMTVDFVPVIDLSIVDIASGYAGNADVTTHDVLFNAADTTVVGARRYVLSENASGVYESKNILELTMTGLESYTQTDFVEGGSVSTGALTDWKAYTADTDVYKIQTPSSDPIGAGQQQTADFDTLVYKVGSNGASYVFEYDVFQVLYNNVGDLDGDVRTSMLIDNGSTFTGINLGAFLSASFNEITVPVGSSGYFINDSSTDSAGNPALTSAGASSAIQCDSMVNGLDLVTADTVKLEIQDGQAGGTRVTYSASTVAVTASDTDLVYSSGFSAYDTFDETDNSVVATVDNDFNNVLSDPHAGSFGGFVYTAYHSTDKGSSKCIVDQTITPLGVGATLSTVSAKQGIHTLDGTTGLNAGAPGNTGDELWRTYMPSKSNLYSRVLVPNGYSKVSKSSLHTNATTLALWTRLNMAFEVENSAPSNAQTVVHATQEASSGDSGDTAVTLNTAESSTDDAFNGRVLKLNTSPVQYRTITDYVGSTKVATLDSALTTTVSDGSTTYSIAGGAMLGGIITAVGDIMMTQNPTSSVASQFVSDTAQSATATTFVHASGTTASTYDNWFVEITSGNGVGQIRKLSGGTSETSTVATWNTTPSGTPTYRLSKVPVPQFVGTVSGTYNQVAHAAGDNNTQGMTLLGATDDNTATNAFDMFTFTDYKIMTLDYEPKVHFTNTARSLASAGTSGSQLAIYRTITIGGEDDAGANDDADIDSQLVQPVGRVNATEYLTDLDAAEAIANTSTIEIVTGLADEFGDNTLNTLVGHPQITSANEQGLTNFGASDIAVRFTDYTGTTAGTTSGWLVTNTAGDPYVTVNNATQPTAFTLDLEKLSIEEAGFLSDASTVYRVEFRMAAHGVLTGTVNEKISGGYELWDDDQVLEASGTDIQMFFTYQVTETLRINLYTPRDTTAYCSKTSGLTMGFENSSSFGSGNLVVTRDAKSMQFEDITGNNAFTENSGIEYWVKHSCAFIAAETAAVIRDNSTAPGVSYAFTNVFHAGDSAKLASISSATYNYTDSNYGSTTGTGAGAADGLHLTQGLFIQNIVERLDDDFTDAAIVPFINGPEDAFLQVIAHNDSLSSTLKVSANPASDPDVEDVIANAFYILCQRVSLGTSGGTDYVRPLGLTHSGRATGGTTTTIDLSSDANAVTTDYYKGRYIHIVSGIGVGQARLITGYDETNKRATVATWTAPDTTSDYEIGCITHSGTAQAGTTTQITLATTAYGTDDSYYAGAEIQIVDGPGAGDVRVIATYTASTKVATVSNVNAFSVAPTSASKYIVGAQVRMGDATGTGTESTSGNTPQSGSATTLVLSASSEGSNDTAYVGKTLNIVAGAGIGEARVITSYTASTRTAAFVSGTTLDNTSFYVINSAKDGSSLESGFRQPANSYYAYSIGLNPHALSMEDLVNDTGDYSAEDSTDTLDYNLNFIVEDAGNSDDRIAQIPLKVQSGGAIQDVALAANNDLSCEGSFAYDLTVTKVGISNANVVWRLMHTAGDVSTLLDGTTNIYAGAISSRFKRHFQAIDSDNLFEGSGYQGSTALEKILKNIKGGKYRLQMAGDTSATTPGESEAIATFSDLDDLNGGGDGSQAAFIATSDVFDTGADHTSTIPYADLGTASTGGLRTGLNKNGDKLFRMRGFGWNTSTLGQDTNTDADFAPHNTEAKDVITWKKVTLEHDLSEEDLIYS